MHFYSVNLAFFNLFILIFGIIFMYIIRFIFTKIADRKIKF